ncbi:MAG: hypothetical protein NXI30_08245 [bacterium]|nr:hypothetical protein [bacterium]
MAESAPHDWTATRFFDLLQKLGRLRVISVCGPSVFEAICEAGPYDVQGGSINMVTPDFHWHFAHARLGFLQSHDTTHARSGRRVLFFSLHETQDDAPFLRIYVYRPPNEEFDPAVIDVFQAAHAELESGLAVGAEESS